MQGPFPPFLRQKQGKRSREEKVNTGAPSSIPQPGTGEEIIGGTEVIQEPLPPFLHQDKGSGRGRKYRDPPSISSPGTGGEVEGGKGNSGAPSSIPPPGTGICRGWNKGPLPISLYHEQAARMSEEQGKIETAAYISLQGT